MFDDVPAAQAHLAELAERPDGDAPGTIAVRVPLTRALAPEADRPDAEPAEAAPAETPSSRRP